MSGLGRLTVLLALCLLTASQAVGGEAGRPKKSTTGAVFRSLAVPGWGQAYNESYIKAILFAGVEGIQLSSIVRFNDKVSAASTVDHHPEQYEAGTPEWNAAAAANRAAGMEEQRYRERRNKTLWWFAATLLLSLGDAYVDAHLYGLDVSPDLSYADEMTVGVKASVNF